MNTLKMNNYFNMFIIILLFPYFFTSSFNLDIQKPSPVSWSFEIKKINESESEILATASINKGWILYSQFTDDNGPVPTQFVIDEKVVRFEEKTASMKEFDPLFEVDVIKFKDKAIFSKIVKKPANGNVNGYVTFMTCDGAKCLPPTDVNFDLNFN